MLFSLETVIILAIVLGVSWFIGWFGKDSREKREEESRKERQIRINALEAEAAMLLDRAEVCKSGSPIAKHHRAQADLLRLKARKLQRN